MPHAIPHGVYALSHHACASASGNASESTARTKSNCRSSSSIRGDNSCYTYTIPARIDAKITSPSESHSKFVTIINIPQGFDVPPPPTLSPTANSSSASSWSGNSLSHIRSESTKSGSKKSKYKKDKKKSRGKGEGVETIFVQ